MQRRGLNLQRGEIAGQFIRVLVCKEIDLRKVGPPGDERSPSLGAMLRALGRIVDGST
jgi:hypothetical protein